SLPRDHLSPAAPSRSHRAGNAWLGVAALNVVHPGPSEAEDSYPYEFPTSEGGHRVRSHRNAKTTPKGRALLVQRVLGEGWSVEETALASGVSSRTVYKWIARYCDGGEAALEDGRSAPRHRPHRVRDHLERWIVRLRGERLSGPAIAR